MSTEPAHIALKKFAKEIGGLNEAVKRVLNEYAEWLANFRREYTMQLGDFLIVRRSLYDQLPFTPDWMKSSDDLPEGIEMQITRKSTDGSR